MTVKPLSKKRKTEILSEKLFEAIENGDQELVKFYVDLGAPLERISKIHWEHDKLTPLLAAVKTGCNWTHSNLEMIEYLLQKGAKVDARDYAQQTPLILAAWNGKQLKTMDLLLRYGADINAQDCNLFTAIMKAAGREDNEFHCFKSFKFLFEHGADTTLEDDRGITVIDLLYEGEYDEYIDYLKSHNEQKNLEKTISVSANSESLIF